MRLHRPAAALVALLAVVSVAACSSSSDDGSDQTGARDTDATETSTTTAAPTTTAVAVSGESVVDAACDGLLESPEPVAVQVPPLIEASGLAVSRNHDGVAWAHNDSGDAARVFAFREGDGGRLAIFRLDGTEAVDWEDMALGPNPDDVERPDTDWLYLADIGDNDAVRQSVSLYRVAEPEVEAAADEQFVRGTLDDIEPYQFQYPDGPRDAESLFIDRTTDSFYIIEKSLDGGPVGIYRGPLAGWNADAAVMPQLERVGTYRPGATIAAAVTSADMTPAGDALAVRTYGAVHLFSRPEGAEIADVLAGTPCDGPIPVEAQGEAVAFVPDGSAYLTLPEGASPTLDAWRP